MLLNLELDDTGDLGGETVVVMLVASVKVRICEAEWSTDEGAIDFYEGTTSMLDDDSVYESLSGFM